MRNYSRFIPGEEIDVVEQWNFGAIDTASQLLAAQVKAREAAEAAAQGQVMQQQGYQSGYAAGIVQGRTQAQAEVRRQMDEFLAKQAKEAGNNLARLLTSAQNQLSDAEQAMAQDVLELTCELARQVLRHELGVNPNVLMPVIREALALLGAQNKSAVVRMNPSDMVVLQDLIQAEFSGLSITLVGDAAVSRGGCLVESAGTVVDGSLQKRWQRAVANLGLSIDWDESNEPS